MSGPADRLRTAADRLRVVWTPVPVPGQGPVERAFHLAVADWLALVAHLIDHGDAGGPAHIKAALAVADALLGGEG